MDDQEIAIKFARYIDKHYNRIFNNDSIRNMLLFDENNIVINMQEEFNIFIKEENIIFKNKLTKEIVKYALIWNMEF